MRWGGRRGRCETESNKSLKRLPAGLCQRLSLRARLLDKKIRAGVRTRLEVSSYCDTSQLPVIIPVNAWTRALRASHGVKSV